MMNKIINTNKYSLGLNILVIFIILILPYYLFNGDLFIGGDDTRLLYVYPGEFLKNISFFSWYNFSSVGIFNPNQFTVPFTALWSLLLLIVQSRIVLDYFSFSLPLLFGYIYFQKFANELFGKASGKLEISVGAILYIFSPIIILNQLSVFLYAAWLIGLLPILCYYFLCYLHRQKSIDILKACLYGTVFSLALFSIPWLLGFFIPLGVALSASIWLYGKKEVLHLIKNALIFLIFLVFSQLFWLLPFSMTFLGGGSNSFGGKVLSQQAADTFSSTVIPTATGNPLIPFINLFHRQIAFDYHWGLQSVYETFYDKILIINIVYIIIFFSGLFFVKKVLDKKELTKYITLLTAFIFSLFLFTVNIGPLKEVFLSFRVIPGMVMFRNFYDKFALGYTLLFALLMTYSLVVLAKRFPQKRYIFASIVAVVAFINLLPIKDTVVRPLWKTNDIYSNITIPQEYMDFMNKTKIVVPLSTNILSLPYDIASYTFIKDSDSNNIFAGTSPVKIFTSINDYSGDLSFPSYDADNVSEYIKNKDYKNLTNIFKEYNISYLFVTSNVPKPVEESYLFNKLTLAAQDNKFINSITDKKLLQSSNGNYTLYSLKENENILQPNNVTYEKINPTTYMIHISHMGTKQELIFLDSFHKQWKVYPSVYQNLRWCRGRYTLSTNQQECINTFQISNSKELMLLFQKALFTNSHTIYNQRSNQWTLDTQTIKQLGDSYYKTNPDGTIDTELVLYFLPQSYFYVGLVVSVGTLGILILLTIIQFKEKKS